MKKISFNQPIKRVAIALLLAMPISGFAADSSFKLPPDVTGDNIMPANSAPSGNGGVGTSITSLLGRSAWNSVPGVHSAPKLSSAYTSVGTSYVNWYMNVYVQQNGDVYLDNIRNGNTITLCSNSHIYLGNIIAQRHGFFQTRIGRCNLSANSNRTNGFEIILHRGGVQVNSHDGKEDRVKQETFLYWSKP